MKRSECAAASLAEIYEVHQHLDSEMFTPPLPLLLTDRDESARANFCSSQDGLLKTAFWDSVFRNQTSIDPVCISLLDLKLGLNISIVLSLAAVASVGELWGTFGIPAKQKDVTPSRAEC